MMKKIWTRAQNIKIGMIGTGQMGQSMIRGLVESGFFPQNLYIYDSNAKTIRSVKNKFNLKSAKNNRQLVSICDVIILAVKPQVLDAVLDEISHTVDEKSLVISIVAGVSLNKIEKAFVNRVGVIRVMPNIPSLIQEGVSCFSVSKKVTDAQKKHAVRILNSFGESYEIPEKSMDVATAISGSGPAYFFLFCEHLIQSAHEMGMKIDLAKKLVYQTAFGSVSMLKSQRSDPDELIQKVTSKKGTTEAALDCFKKKGFGKVIADALMAAKNRSEELRGE